MPRGVQSFNPKVFEYFLYASGFSDVSFAEAIGVSLRLIHFWRTNGRKPTKENLSKIAETLDITQSTLKMSDDAFSELVKDVTHQDLRKRLMFDKLFDSFNQAIDGDSAEEWRHALRVAVYFHEVYGAFGGMADGHTTLKDAMQIEQIEADNSDDTEDDLDNDMNEIAGTE